MKRDYKFISSAPHMDYMKEFLELGIEGSGKLLYFETVAAPTSRAGTSISSASTASASRNGSKTEVQRILSGLKGTEGFKVERIDGFPDFSFAPLASPEVEERQKADPRLCHVACTKKLYEFCEISGPERYGAIGAYWDSYRFYAGRIDMADAKTIFDVEDSLEICVQRIANYIRTGRGRTNVNLTRRYVPKSMFP